LFLIQARNDVQNRQRLVVAVDDLGGVYTGDHGADGDHAAEIRGDHIANWFHLSGGNVQAVNSQRHISWLEDVQGTAIGGPLRHAVAGLHAGDGTRRSSIQREQIDLVVRGRARQELAIG
jgi:hypothetical protein